MIRCWFSKNELQLVCNLLCQNTGIHLQIALSSANLFSFQHSLHNATHPYLSGSPRNNKCLNASIHFTDVLFVPTSWSRSCIHISIVRAYSIQTDVSTLCSKKKEATKLLAIALSNLNRFSKFFHCWKEEEISNKMA